jgi:hypothetical protein
MLCTEDGSQVSNFVSLALRATYASD